MITYYCSHYKWLRTLPSKAINQSIEVNIHSWHAVAIHDRSLKEIRKLRFFQFTFFQIYNNTLLFLETAMGTELDSKDDGKEYRDAVQEMGDYVVHR